MPRQKKDMRALKTDWRWLD